MIQTLKKLNQYPEKEFTFKVEMNDLHLIGNFKYKGSHISNSLIIGFNNELLQMTPFDLDSLVASSVDKLNHMLQTQAEAY